MKNRGIEPPIKGYTDDDGFNWVIDGLTACLKTAEKCGVVLGLENHWGLGRTPEGVMKIVDAINSPWLQVTMDTGNFLEDPYDKLEKLAPKTVLVQAKTYYGGGLWYTLDLDYDRIAKMLQQAQVPRLRVAGVRGEGRPEDGDSEEPGDVAEGVWRCVTVAGIARIQLDLNSGESSDGERRIVPFISRSIPAHRRTRRTHP